MKTISGIVLSSLVSTMLLADTIDIKSGWNLVGFNTKTDVETLKSLDGNISKVFLYDNEYKEDGVINPSDGIWIQSDNDISIDIKDSSNHSDRIDKIDLVAGWNLKSLPVNSALTPKIFNGKIIWRYKDSSWSRYSKDASSSDYPSIDILASGEGFWVKSDSAETIYISDEESKLTNFSSQEELESYLDILVNYNRNFRSNNFYLYPVLELTTTDAVAYDGINKSGVDDATTTNTQESGVDEADILKHNGDKIFYLSNNWESSGIYVTTFDRLLNAQSKPATTIPTTSRANELYLIDNTLVVIYPTNYNFWGVWDSIDYNLWSEKSRVEFYDVSNIEDIKLSKTYEIDGNIIDSRVTNSKLYLVTRFMPNYKVEYQKDYDCTISQVPVVEEPISVDSDSATLETKRMMLPYTESCYLSDDNGTLYKYNYEKFTIESKNLLPKYYVDKEAKELIDYNKIYAPAKVNQSSFITSISSIAIDDLNSFESVSSIGNADTIYASENSIYLTSREYPIYFGFNDYKERSTIYKFNIKDSLDFVSKGFVDGRILNQFSLSEYNDSIRIATTEGFSWMGDTNNTIYTLRDNDSSLNVVGSLSGLGKEGETIKAVRFFGDRGFVVTFKQSDPFYTIDLSTDTPKKVGELEISGFSTYFHMVDSDSILSIGREADENGRALQLQLELFDISDFANPKLADKKLIPEDVNYSIDGGYIYSEAEYNHKAFTFRDSDKTLALPITKMDYSTKEYSVLSSLNFFKVSDSKIVDFSTPLEANDNQYGYGYQRGVIFSKDSKDYALYLSSDNLYIKELQ